MADDDELIIACSLTGGGQVERFQQWQELLGTGEFSREPLAIHAAIASDKAAVLAELARDEQRCCPFLGFRVDFRGAILDVTVTAPNEAAAAFLDAFAPKAKPIT